MDTESLVKSLNENKVRFVIIGATAFPVHGYSRATLDIDIFIENTIANVKRTLKALKDTGYDVTDVSTPDMRSKKILIREYILETDIHPFVKGASFKNVWKKKVKGKIGSQPAYFASLEDLIIMKKAAGRKKDKEDLKILRKLKTRTNRNSF